MNKLLMTLVTAVSVSSAWAATEVQCQGSQGTLHVLASPETHQLSFTLDTQNGIVEGSTDHAFSGPNQSTQVSTWPFTDSNFHKNWFDVMASTDEKVWVPEHQALICPHTRVPNPPCHVGTIPGAYSNRLVGWLDLQLQILPNGTYAWSFLDAHGFAGIPNQSPIGKDATCTVTPLEK